MRKVPSIIYLGDKTMQVKTNVKAGKKGRGGRDDGPNHT